MYGTYTLIAYQFTQRAGQETLFTYSTILCTQFLYDLRLWRKYTAEDRVNMQNTQNYLTFFFKLNFFFRIFLKDFEFLYQIIRLNGCHIVADHFSVFWHTICVQNISFWLRSLDPRLYREKLSKLNRSKKNLLQNFETIQRCIKFNKIISCNRVNL